MISLKKQILYCLEQYPETRNNDISLTIKVWLNFPAYNEDKGRNVKMIYSEKTKKYYVELSDLHWLQREDVIKRERAIIQNVEKRFLPTDPKIAEFRKRNGRGETKWLKEHGYKTNKFNL